MVLHFGQDVWQYAAQGCLSHAATNITTQNTETQYVSDRWWHPIEIENLDRI